MTDIILLAPDNIEATAATQVRTKIHPETVKIYTEALENGAIMPPLDVFCEEGSERYILADGFHRHRAYVNVEAKEIECRRHIGGMLEALIFALGANETHGLRRSNGDKRLAVKMALKDPQISQYSLREIAEICKVSHTTVATIRNELQTADDLDDPDTTDHNPDNEKPADPDEGDLAVDKEATQAEVDKREIEEACKAIMSLPYSGKDAVERLAPDQDLIRQLEYVGIWCTDMAMKWRLDNPE
jgi:uncharacterized ParB-like nuclease family protein